MFVKQKTILGLPKALVSILQASGNNTLDRLQCSYVCTYWTEQSYPIATYYVDSSVHSGVLVVKVYV